MTGRVSCMNSFSFYYILANVVCVIVFGIMLVHNHFNIDRQEKQVKFDKALLAFICYFITDCFWAAIVDGILPKSLFAAVTFLIYLCMVATVYNWLDFVMAYEQIPNRNKPRHRIVRALPFVVSTVILILHFLIAPQMLINYETLETQTAFTVYLSLVPDMYMIAILFYTIRRARQEENPSEKRKHLFIGLYPLTASVFGLVQEIFFPYAPIYCYACLILMLVFYIQSIELRVSQDPLTGLNNRGQLERYISQRSNLYIEGRATVVIMMDIDRFKAINDTYGHAEGDKALIIVSDALKTSVNRHSMPSFLCRYGGDEFLLIIHPTAIEEAGQLILEIREEIDRREKEFPLSVSAGYDTLGNTDDTIQDCIIRADKKLYEDKKRERQ